MKKNVTQSDLVTTSNAECPSYDSDATQVPSDEEIYEPQAKRRRRLSYIKMETLRSMNEAKEYLKNLDKSVGACGVIERQ